MKIKVELGGGLEILFDKVKEYEIELIDENTGEEKSYIKEPYGLKDLSKYIFERR